MVVLDILCIVVALVALAFGVVAVITSRGAAEKAASAVAAATHAETTSVDARTVATGAEETADAASARAAEARRDGARALEAATTASRSAERGIELARQAETNATSAGDAAATTAIEIATLTRKLSAAEEQSRGTTGHAPTLEADSSPQAASKEDVEDGVRTEPQSESEAFGPQSHEPSRTVVHPDAGAAPRASTVTWRLEQVRGSTWIVYNSGATVAHAALLTDITQPPKFIRPDEVIPREVAPGDHLQLRVTAGRGTPPPRIRVSWRDVPGGAPLSAEFTLVLDD